MFIGREREFKRLEDFLLDSDKRVFCIYGRQGMGKSALLKGFLQEHRGIYFPAYKTTEDQQLTLLKKVLNIKLLIEGLIFVFPVMRYIPYH